MTKSSTDLYQLSQDATRILDASPVPFAINDDDQRITYLNPAFTRIFGYDINDIPTLSDWWPKAYPDEDYRHYVETTWAKNLNDAAQNNSAFEPLELRILCKDQSYKVVTAYAASLSGSYKGIHLVILHDITDSINASNEIRQAKNLLENVINSTPDLIFVKNTELDTVLCNTAYAEALGKCSENSQGDVEQAFISEEDENALAGASIHNPYQKLTIEGRPRTYDIKKLPLRDATDNIVGLLGICRDITEQQRIEKNLQETEQRLRLATEAAEMGIWEWHIPGNTVYWDNNMFHLYGLAPRANGIVNYSDWASTLLPEELAEQEAILKNTIQNQGKSEREFHITRNDNHQIRVISATETVRLNAAGEVEYLVGINQDVTNTRLAEEKQQRTQKMDALGKLTGGIAHDFNNMLSIILGYAELLEKNADINDKNKRHIQEIITAGNRARKLTSSLLTFSRRGTSEFTSTVINQQILKDQHMLERVLTAQIQLELDLSDDLWTCMMDNELLGDAILNMSINAMQAMPGGGKLSITTSNCSLTSRDTHYLSISPGEYVKLTIADNGVGMSKETRDKIFEPFFSTKGELGTGLGMSQVYGLIKQAKGDISIESFPSQGTHITIYLPRYVEESELTTTTSVNAATQEKLSGHESILIVDDEPALRELTREILEMHGYQVFIADGGQQALQILTSETIDLILCDIIMPGMNGFELANIVRDKYPDVKIQMISGYSDDYFISDDNRQLHEDRLQKPCSKNMLLNRLRKIFAYKANA